LKSKVFDVKIISTL